MSREIPQVVRAAAGLAATVLDEARKLPQTLPGLPVRVIGFAMQKAMWVQQQFSGLVARGDEVFTGIRGENEPGMATFEEDLPADEAPAPAATPPGFRDSAFDRAEVPAEEDVLSGLAEDDVALPDASAAEAADAETAEASEQIAEQAGTGADTATDTDTDTGTESGSDTGEEALEDLAIEDLAIEELVGDENAGLPADPAPAEVVAAVESITEQVESAGLADAAARPTDDTATDDTATDDTITGDATGDTVTEDADALENALLEADAAGTAETTGTPGGAPDTVSDVVDVLTPDGDVATVEAAVTDEGVAAPEAPTDDTPAGDTPAGETSADETSADQAVDEGGTAVAAATGVSTEVAEDTGPADDEGSAGAQAAGTAPIEGYDSWSIAQLRGRLRGYQAVTVADLVSYEEATRAREPYLRMLRNRLEKLDQQAIEASPLAPRGA